MAVYLFPRGFGWQPDEPDARDYSFARSSDDPPPSAALTQHLHPILDQGGTQACVGFAIAQSLYVAHNVRFGKASLANPYAIYTMARRLKHGRDAALVDVGSAPRYAWQALRDGLVLCEEWPLDIAQVHEEIPLHAWRSAVDRTWVEYYRIESERTRNIKCAIAQGLPVCLGLTVDAAFEYFRGPGPWRFTDDEVIGRHYVAVVGYCDEYAVIANSWGSLWGFGGIGLVAWDEVENTRTSDIVVPQIRRLSA